MEAGGRPSAAEARGSFLVLGLGLQAVFTVFGFAVTFTSTLSIASCTATSCDYTAFSAAIDTFYVGALVLLAATVVAMLLLGQHPRARSWAPMIGTVLLLLLLAATYVAGRAALTLPLFGNRLPGCC
ncbi:hypothetical protein [Microbacterium sp. K41]|uniref:hypothetical protein n=1 Tax=Microbacterium sp. K41 TaxID=2305437 RepID=UPI00109D0390|nr:hypothetical protein [Microbacterium sp. K41]